MRLRDGPQARCWIPILTIFGAHLILLAIARPQFSISDISEELNRALQNETDILLKQIYGPVAPTINKTESRILNKRRRPVQTDAPSSLSGTAKIKFEARPDFLFPDDPLVSAIPVLKHPPECAGSGTFCEKFDAYPRVRVGQILESKEVQPYLFGKDESPSDEGLITDRFAVIEESFVCGSTRKTVFPKIGKTSRDEWKIIINQEDSDKYIQGVMVETCSSEGEACSIIGELPDGYTVTCRQKFLYRKLMSVSASGDPVPESFQFPSACCCAYKRDSYEFMTRSKLPDDVTPVSRKHPLR